MFYNFARSYSHFMNLKPDATQDPLIQAARLQHEIAERLGIAPENLVFDFREQGSKVRLDLVTINPKHGQSFLFHTTTGESRLDALYAMLNYVKTYKEKDQSFTIQWALKGENELHTSYFRAANIFEALEKFSYGRDVNSVIIFSVTLNPIS